jgi:hypothetical protein
MPGLGDPLIREMRKIAAAHAAFPGDPPRDPGELLGWYETVGSAGAATEQSEISRREFLRRSAVLGAGVAGGLVFGWSRARPASAGTGAGAGSLAFRGYC